MRHLEPHTLFNYSARLPRSGAHWHHVGVICGRARPLRRKSRNRSRPCRGAYAGAWTLHHRCSDAVGAATAERKTVPRSVHRGRQSTGLLPRIHCWSHGRWSSSTAYRPTAPSSRATAPPPEQSLSSRRAASLAVSPREHNRREASGWGLSAREQLHQASAVSLPRTSSTVGRGAAAASDSWQGSHRPAG